MSRLTHRVHGRSCQEEANGQLCLRGEAGAHTKSQVICYQWRSRHRCQSCVQNKNRAWPKRLCSIGSGFGSPIVGSICMLVCVSVNVSSVRQPDLVPAYRDSPCAVSSGSHQTQLLHRKWCAESSQLSAQHLVKLPPSPWNCRCYRFCSSIMVIAADAASPRTKVNQLWGTLAARAGGSKELTYLPYTVEEELVHWLSTELLAGSSAHFLLRPCWRRDLRADHHPSTGAVWGQHLVWRHLLARVMWSIHLQNCRIRQLCSL